MAQSEASDTGTGRPAIALLGAGRMGALHARVIRDEVPALRLVAVGEPSAAVRERAREVLAPETALYEDPIAALDHPGLAACLIATPTHTHPAIVEAALERGLHVFCEKPLSLDDADSERLAAAAAAAGRVLQVGFWRRFSPAWSAAKAAIAAGEIGAPVMLRSSQWDAAIPPLSFCDPAVSGGLMIDCGVHDFDIVEWMAGAAIERVHALPTRLVEPALARFPEYDNAIVLLELAGGVQASVDLSRNVGYADDVRMDVVGERGALLIEIQPRARVRLGNAAGGLRDLPLTGPRDAFVAGIAGELTAFAAALGGAPVDYPHAAASVAAMRVARAANRSARSGDPVAVEA